MILNAVVAQSTFEELVNGLARDEITSVRRKFCKISDQHELMVTAEVNEDEFLKVAQSVSASIEDPEKTNLRGVDYLCVDGFADEVNWIEKSFVGSVSFWLKGLGRLS